MKILITVKVHTKYGIFYIHELDHKLYAISRTKLEKAIIKETPLLKIASKHLNDFLEGRLFEFDLPFLIEGTKFQKDIYQALLKVKYGQTISYKALATTAGYPNAYRAVGSAMDKNKLPFIIPCHRVIKNDGSLGNYGFGLKLKRYLINLEAKYGSNSRN